MTQLDNYLLEMRRIGKTPTVLNLTKDQIEVLGLIEYHNIKIELYKDN